MLSFFAYQLLLAVLFPFYWLIHRPDALMIRGGTGPTAPLFRIARLMGVRCVLEVNGISWTEHESRGFPSILCSLIRHWGVAQARATNAIVAVTPQIGQAWAQAAGTDPAAVYPVQNGADPIPPGRQEGQALRQKLGIPQDAFVVGYTGKFCVWHGMEEIVRSAAKLPDEVRSRVRFLLIGDGEEFQMTRDLIEQLGLAEQFVLPGLVPHEQVAACMQAFDIGLFLTTDDSKIRFGTSPLKFWEYLAAGLPVIVSDDCNITPIVSSRKMGYVIPHPTADDLAETIRHAMTHRGEVEQMGRQNRMLLEKEFSWRHVAARVAWVCGDRSAKAEPVPSLAQEPPA